MVIISLLAALVLYLSGTPLLSLINSRTASSPDGSVTVAHFEIHWPLLAVGAAGIVGLLVAAWPQRQPPRLQP